MALFVFGFAPVCPPCPFVDFATEDASSAYFALYALECSGLLFLLGEWAAGLPGLWGAPWLRAILFHFVEGIGYAKEHGEDDSADGVEDDVCHVCVRF